MTALAPHARPAGADRAAFASTPSSIYAVVVAVFCGLLLISNVAATKPITVLDDVPGIGGIFTDGGALLFPLTYVLGDVLAEVYGLRHARRAIWVGFALAVLASVTFLAVAAAPPGPGYENSAAFSAVLGFVPRIVFASLCGYLAGQLLNAWVVVALKERTQERRLWARLVGSTVVGELADTALFCVIAFVGVFPTWAELISYTVTGYLYKVAVEIVLLPLTYAVIRAIKRREPAYATAGQPVQSLRVVLRAEDYEAALRFYRDELGLTEQASFGSGRDATGVILDAGRASVALVDPGRPGPGDTEGPAATPEVLLAFHVADAGRTVERLRSSGAEVVEPVLGTTPGWLVSRPGLTGTPITLFDESADSPR